jgi:HSP20 family molecular chaperone IbpA
MKRERLPDKQPFDPPVRRTDTGRELHLCIGLPGITEEQIRLDLEKSSLTVSILDHGRPVKKTIRVPQGTRVSRKKFSDGILEIFLEKPVS